jgi:hypothetical protein
VRGQGARPEGKLSGSVKNPDPLGQLLMSPEEAPPGDWRQVKVTSQL